MLWIVGVLTVYLLGLFAIAWFSLHPMRTPLYISPGSMGAAQAEITIQSQGNALRGWWVEASNSKVVMICSHGYMMSRCELTPEAYHLWKAGISCVLMDFRAHGRSGGRKCTLGVLEKEDILAVVREVRRRNPRAKIGLFGSSMGAAASVFAAADAPGEIDFLVLDSAYGQLSDAILGWWRFLGGRWLALLLGPSVVVCAPLAGFNPFRINVTKALADLPSMPVLFMHGSADNLALPREAQANIDATKGPKQIHWFAGCGHSEGRWLQPDIYREILFGFLATHGFVERHETESPNVEMGAR